MRLLKLLTPAIITTVSLTLPSQAKDTFYKIIKEDIPISQSQIPTEPQKKQDYKLTEILAIINPRDEILEATEIKYKR